MRVGNWIVPAAPGCLWAGDQPTAPGGVGLSLLIFGERPYVIRTVVERHPCMSGNPLTHFRPSGALFGNGFKAVQCSSHCSPLSSRRLPCRPAPSSRSVFALGSDLRAMRVSPRAST